MIFIVWYPLYVSGSYTFGNRTITFRMIQTNHANITIEDIGTSHIGNAAGNPYGINGTFFYMGTPPEPAVDAGYVQYDNYRIVINNGVVVREKGDHNRLNQYEDGPCGTLGWFKNPVGGKSYFCEDITKIKDLGTDIGNIQWAIGGSNLYLNENLTQTQFENRVRTGQDPTYASTTTRSAIILRTSSPSRNDVVLITAFGNGPDGLTLWELRTYILDLFGYEIEQGFPIVGISIDGGGYVSHEQSLTYQHVQGL